MRYSSLPGTSKSASLIALGTAWFGTAIPQDQAFNLMDAYRAQGGNFLDTAHMYANWVEGGAGQSERSVGAWLKRAGREGMVVATKGADRAMTRAAIREQLEESLDRLDLPAVDFYWLHVDDPKVPVGEVLGWLNELAGEGRMEAFGCSNWSLPRLREAQAYAREHGLKGFAASQIGWGLGRVNFEVLRGPAVHMTDDIFAWHVQSRLPVAAYSAQAGGFYGGGYDPANPVPGLTANPNIVRLHGNPGNYARQRIANRLAKEKGATPNQIALAYLLHQPFPAFAIAGANTPQRVADACAAANVTLTPAEVAELDSPSQV